MKQTSLPLRCIILFITVQSALHSETLTNRTVLRSRPYAFSLPLQFTTWHRHAIVNERQHGIGLYLTSFYRISTNGDSLGRYFGSNESNTLSIGHDSDIHNIESRALIHRAVPFTQPQNATDLKATIQLKPQEEIWGGMFIFRHDLDNVLSRLFYQINIPITRTETNVNLKQQGGQPDSTLNTSALDYFKGIVTQPDGPNKQQALTHAKIDGSQTSTGVSDVALHLGLTIADSPDYRSHLSGVITIPLMQENKGEFLFEPTSGFAHHYSLGFHYACTYNLYRSESLALDTHIGLMYRMLLDATEKRTLGFKQDDKTTVQWSHYLLCARSGEKGTLPFANVTTRDVKVSPGSQVEGILAWSLHSASYTIDFGYNVFAREGEKLHLPVWPDNQYVFASFSYNAEEDFALGLGTVPPNTTFEMNIGTGVTQDRLNLTTATTPACLTHTLFLGIGRIFGAQQPWGSGALGASYEFTAHNAALDGIMIWGKLAFVF